MSGNRKPQYNYKLFNTRTKKYMSWRNKGTWTQRTWLASRLHGERIEEIEVHIFPVAEPIIQSAKSFLEEEAIAEMDKRLEKASIEERRRKDREKQQYEEDLQKLKDLQAKIELYEKLVNK